MKLLRTVSCFVLLSSLLAGCGPGGKKVSERDLREAAALSSEAQFAMSLKDWTRAEKLLLQAIQITPDPVFYHNLGSARMRMGNRAGAKEAYQSAISACDRLASANKATTDPLLKKVLLLALLGKVDDARALEKKIEKEFPKDKDVRAFVDGKKLDALVASPLFKEIGL